MKKLALLLWLVASPAWGAVSVGAALAALLFPVVSWAGSTGLKHGSAFSDVSSAWINETDIYASDDAYASDATSGTNNYLYVTGFNMSVPADSVIDSITVFIEGYGSIVSSRRCVDVSLTKDGSSSSGEEVSTLCLGIAGSEGPFQAVPTDPLWSTTWTVSEVNSSNFGVRIDQTQSTTSIIRVDDITVNVWYHGVASYLPHHHQVWIVQ